jgi:hypothetical protein
MRCDALHGAWLVCDAMRCELVAFARCRRRHAFDGGIFRVGFFGFGSTSIRSTIVTGQTEGLKGWLRRDGQRDGCQYMYCLPPAGGRIRSQGNYYCLPPAGGRIRSPRLN